LSTGVGLKNTAARLAPPTGRRGLLRPPPPNQRQMCETGVAPNWRGFADS
jgi:hypothetical protein